MARALLSSICFSSFPRFFCLSSWLLGMRLINVLVFLFLFCIFFIFFLFSFYFNDRTCWINEAVGKVFVGNNATMTVRVCFHAILFKRCENYWTRVNNFGIIWILQINRSINWRRIFLYFEYFLYLIDSILK